MINSYYNYILDVKNLESYEYLKRDVEILEVKTTVSEIQNTLDEINDSLDITKGSFTWRHNNKNSKFKVKQIALRDRNLKITTDFLSEAMQARIQWRNVLKYLNKR